MPSSVGPNTFGEENLVFGYDLGDVANSYKGEPTVNLAANGGLVGMSGISLTDLGIEDGWRKYSMSGTFNGGTYPYIMRISGYTFTAGVQYSSRCTVRTNVPQKFNYFGANGISYVNEPMSNGGTLSSIVNTDGSYTVGRFGFAYVSTTNQPGYLWTNPINGTTFTAATDFVWIKYLQVEQNPHPTPFVNGTRSATQGLLDLTGNSTINLSNVSFDSNAQMTFDGTNDQFVISNPGVGTSFSIEITIKVNSYGNSPIFISPNSVGIDHFFRVNSNGNIFARFVEIADSLTDNYTSSTVLNSTNYYHVVISKSPSNGTIYVNGVAEDSHTPTLPAAAWSGDWRIGARWNSTFWFNGELPLFKVYSRALTASEVQSNYNAIKGRFNI
jgi:hypothetical protein